MTINENWGARNAPEFCGNKTKLNSTQILIALQEAREESWLKAIKYRWDPTIGPIHEDYLNLLNRLLRAWE